MWMRQSTIWYASNEGEGKKHVQEGPQSENIAYQWHQEDKQTTMREITQTKERQSHQAPRL